MKNIILSTLIICALFLTSQIWFNKKLWPDGYNFFGYAENLPIIGRFFNNSDESINIEESVAQLAVPYKAVVSNAGKREVFVPNQKEFDIITRMSFGIIDSLFEISQPEYSQVPLDELKSIITENSVFLTFEYDMDTAFIAGARGMSGETISHIAPSFAHIAITSDSSGNAVVYMCNSDNSQIYRFPVPDNGDKAQKIIGAYARKNENYAFAYELNLDAPSDVQSENDRLYLSSFVLVNVGIEDPEKLIMASSPFGSELNQRQCDKLVESFGLEANTLRRSQDSDGTQKYIENSATITISPRGVITYTAVENQAGITADTTSAKIEAVLNIVIRQWALLFPDSPLSLCVAENMTSKNDTSVISFNYVINGKPVIFRTDKCENGITAYFKGNKLVSAKFNYCNLTVLEDTDTPMPMLENFDTAYEQLGIDKPVTHAILCYAVKPELQQPFVSTLAITYGDTTGIIE